MPPTAAIPKIAGAAAEGWLNTPTILKPFFGIGNAVGHGASEAWNQIAGAPAPSAPTEDTDPPGDTQLTTVQGARERVMTDNANHSGYFALEPNEPGFAHLLWSLGAPFAAIGQTALGERPLPAPGLPSLEMAAPLAGMGDLRFPPRVSPMMEAFDAATAARKSPETFQEEMRARAAAPEPPPPPGPLPPDPATSGIARVHSQIGKGQEAPPPSPIPADAAPPGVPPGTDVPMSLRLRAAIDAGGPAPSSTQPNFVPQTNVDPLTGQATSVRVPPGASGPATVPYAPPTPEAASGAAPAEAPGPRSAGAAGTPFADAALTPEQTAAAGSTADKQWLYQTAVPGEADATEYVKGITPTMAQREQTVNAARDSKLLRRISPDAEQAERALLAEHTDIRKGEFQDIAGSDVTHEAEMKAASDQIETQLQAAYAHGGTVDLQPVIAAANAELRGSAGKLPPVKAAMKAIVDAAEKSDGSGLETDPRQANAVRRAIIYMQSREGKLENPGYGHPDTLAALTRVKDVLTKQVEPAAPGFTEANANYARARQATDAREALQAYEPRLYDGLGNMRYQAFHRMMGDIVKARDPNAPLGPVQGSDRRADEPAQVAARRSEAGGERRGSGQGERLRHDANAVRSGEAGGAARHRNRGGSRRRVRR